MRAVGVYGLVASLVALAVAVTLAPDSRQGRLSVAAVGVFAGLVSLSPAFTRSTYPLLLLYWVILYSAYFFLPRLALTMAAAVGALHALSLWLLPASGLGIEDWIVVIPVLAVPAVLVGLLRATVDGLGPVLAELLDSAPEPLVLVDSRERIVSANRAFTRLVACEPFEAIGRPLADYLTRPAAGWETSSDELSYLRTPDGNVPVRAQIASHTPRGHRGLRLVLLADERARVAELGEREAQLAHERTERLQLERIAAHLRQEAETDRLTGVYNRRGLERVFALHSADGRLPGRPAVVALADLDHFKRLNDTHGHSVADDVLRVVAARLVAAGRETDVVARYGGDEFVIFMPDVAVDPDELFERIHKQVSSPIHLPASDGPVDVAATISVGLACGVPAQTSLDELLQWADTALYQAKRTGRDRVVRHQGHRRPGSAQPPAHTPPSARSDKIA